MALAEGALHEWVVAERVSADSGGTLGRGRGRKAAILRYQRSEVPARSPSSWLAAARGSYNAGSKLLAKWMGPPIPRSRDQAKAGPWRQLAAKRRTRRVGALYYG